MAEQLQKSPLMSALDVQITVSLSAVEVKLVVDVTVVVVVALRPSLLPGH